MAPGPERTLSLCCQPQSGLLLWPHLAPAVGGDHPVPWCPDIQQTISKSPRAGPAADVHDSGPGSTAGHRGQVPALARGNSFIQRHPFLEMCDKLGIIKMKLLNFMGFSLQFHILQNYRSGYFCHRILFFFCRKKVHAAKSIFS